MSAHTRPVHCFNLRAAEQRDPPRREIHVNNQLHAGEVNFALLHAPRGIAQGLQDVLTFEVRIVGQQLFDAAAGADLPKEVIKNSPLRLRLS